MRDEPDQIYRIGLVAVPFLLSFADLLIGWLLLRQAETALNALDDNPTEADASFYRGKIVAAKFFVMNVLPRLGADGTSIEHADLFAMELSEADF